MYYDEEIINGVLCYRHTPNGEFKQFTAEELTHKITIYDNLISELQAKIAVLRDEL